MALSRGLSLAYLPELHASLTPHCQGEWVLLINNDLLSGARENSKMHE